MILALLVVVAAALLQPLSARSIERRALLLPPPPPDGCKTPKWEVTKFKWTNSTNNLNCYSGPDLLRTGCITSTIPVAWCEKNTANCTNCGIPLCSTGLPNQPTGYDPPDTIEVDVAGAASCYDINPKSYRRHDIGNGVVECGTAARVMEFHGTSREGRNTGRLTFRPINSPQTCGDGSRIVYSGNVEFTYTCKVDPRGNAKCEADKFEIPVSKWEPC